MIRQHEKNVKQEIGKIWSAHAEPLARWVAARLVNRTDCRGAYRPPSEWGREYRKPDGTTGKLGKTFTDKGLVTHAVLVRHFRAISRADLIGLHSTAANNTCRWGALDIDWHGPTSTSPAVNSQAAIGWYDNLTARGFRPLLTDSNGAGGYHLRVLLDGPAPSAQVHHFLRQMIADHPILGMEVPPELFPKQPVLRPRPDGSPGFGNWLRLPGRHHTRDHWSEVWNGRTWLNGRNAIEYILGLTGDVVELLPPIPPPRPKTPRRFPCYSGPHSDRRIAAYLRRLPNLGEGQGRDNVGYHFACFLVRDLALSDDEALSWLSRWDSSNNPPKGEARLQEILVSAHNYGRAAVGSGLQQKVFSVEL